MKGSLLRDRSGPVKSAFRSKSPSRCSHTSPANNSKGGRRYRLYAYNSTRRKDQKERAASYAHEDAGRQTAVWCLHICYGRASRPKPWKPRPAVVSIPRGPVLRKLPKAAVARNVSNEGTATTKTVWYRIVRMVDLQEMESQGEMDFCVA